MNKKVFFTLACAAVLALGFVCQKQSSLNALVDNNIEALTSSGEGGANVSFEPLSALTTGYTDYHYDPSNYNLTIPVWCETTEGWRKGALIETGSTLSQILHAIFGGDANKYLCTLGEGNKYDGVCYEIVVRP